MDFRKIFDTIPEQFDKWRPHYCDELFNDLIEHSKLDSTKKALEIGPGTGQATEPILKTGCSYLAIELGEHLAEFMNNKFKSYDNFRLVNADFETYDFGRNRFDLVYSAAAFQWIKREIGYPKVYNILKSGGTFAHFAVAGGSRVPALDDKIQEVYAEYFRPEIDYDEYMKQKNEHSQIIDPIQVSNPQEELEHYGFVDIECRHYNKIREFNADDYVSYIHTHAPHITLQKPYKSKVYEGIRDVILKYGNDKVTLDDDIILYISRKPS
ncbi:MAG: methyltransferase domain-containing protein [Oscillospiraceae bacterium]|nr:methyltransferase domain-containing protein [Oscillospiraceae bacterium]